MYMEDPCPIRGFSQAARMGAPSPSAVRRALTSAKAIPVSVLGRPRPWPPGTKVIEPLPLLPPRTTGGYLPVCPIRGCCIGAVGEDRLSVSLFDGTERFVLGLARGDCRWKMQLIGEERIRDPHRVLGRIP